MTELNVVVTILASIGTILSVTFAILAFSRNKSIDKADLQSRLIKIETDITYIRENLDDSKTWKKDVEDRLRKIEKGGV